MRRLESKKFLFPVLYLVSPEEKEDLAPGIPYIIGEECDYARLVRLIEYQILFQSCLKTGLEFNWKEILKDNGYAVIQEDCYVGEYSESEKGYAELEGKPLDEYLRYTGALVNMKKLLSLHIIPEWIGDIKESITTNIANSVVYNPYMYNKKLGICCGVTGIGEDKRNLIIIDISGSIPKSISSILVSFAKTLTESFYADLLITGSKSTLYDFNEVKTLDITKVFKDNECDNDQVYFKKLVSQPRSYNTCICFGDGHSPSMAWDNSYNQESRVIPLKEGRDLNKWEISHILSFHTDDTSVAGYATWFTCPDVKIIKKWCKYFKNK